jgi:hypothetical protein
MHGPMNVKFYTNTILLISCTELNYITYRYKRTIHCLHEPEECLLQMLKDVCNYIELNTSQSNPIRPTDCCHGRITKGN